MKPMKKMFALLLAAVLLSVFAACGAGNAGEAGSQAGAAVSFSFSVQHKDGTEKQLTIETQQTTVGAALLEQGLIAGEEGSVGFYVTTVDGVTLDFERDQAYWGFHINGEYAMQGVNATEIDPSASYAFIYMKG